MIGKPGMQQHRPRLLGKGCKAIEQHIWVVRQRVIENGGAHRGGRIADVGYVGRIGGSHVLRVVSIIRVLISLSTAYHKAEMLVYAEAGMR